MALEEQINAEIKTAMLAKDSKRLEALRAIKSAILLLKTSPEGLTDATELKAIQKMVKQREDAAEVYTSQGRADLAEVELEQAEVIKVFLPKQMDDAELRAELQKIIQSVGASSPADMGKVMGTASKALAGKADGKRISQIVREILAG